MRPSLVVKVKGGHGEGTGSEFHYGQIFLLVKKKKGKTKILYTLLIPSTLLRKHVIMLNVHLVI